MKVKSKKEYNNTIFKLKLFVFLKYSLLFINTNKESIISPVTEYLRSWFKYIIGKIDKYSRAIRVKNNTEKYLAINDINVYAFTDIIIKRFLLLILN